MRWWCSAQGVAWEWTWQPYLGVWLLILLLTAAYLRIVRRSTGRYPRPDAPRTWAFGAGLLALWLALDWPVGALAAGYLASLHMLQFLLVALVAPALLLLSVPDAAWRVLAGRRVAGVLARVTQPLAAIVLFNLIVVVTHWPLVVDGLMGSQAGSFAIDMLWGIGGLVLWWPVVSPVPARPRFGYFLKVAYLIATTITMSATFIYLTFSSLPVYATYELAPPIEGLSKREDQQLAGILMKLGGAVILWTAITALFFRWYREEEGPLA